MEDSVSVKSNDSATTSDEYEFVNGLSSAKGLETASGSIIYTNHHQPLLDISNNGNLDDLKKCLGEVLSEESLMDPEKKVNSGTGNMEENAG